MQPGSPAHTPSSTSPPGVPPGVTIVGTRRFLIGLTACVLVFGALYWISSKVAEQGKLADANREKTTRIGEKLVSLESETKHEFEKIPDLLDEYQRRLQAAEEALEALREPLEVLRQQAHQQQASNAGSLAQTLGLRNQGEKTKKTLQKLSNDLQQWDVRLSALMSDESKSGKRIAAGPVLLERFMTIVDEPCVSQDDVTDWTEQLELILTPVARACRDSDGSFKADETLVAKFDELEKVVDEAAIDLERQRHLLSAIEGQTSKDPITGDVPSLGQAVEAQYEQRALERAQIINERLDRVRKETAEEIADAKEQAQRQIDEETAKAERLIGEVEARRIAEAVQDLAARERERIRKRQEELARKQLEADFQRDLPEIESLLKPFISDGYAQPGRHGVFERTTEKGPVSLSGLKGASLLENKIELVRQFHRVVAGQQLNDRPLGSFPPSFVFPREWAHVQPRVQRAQELLNKCGELMVEKKMLAP